MNSRKFFACSTFEIKNFLGSTSRKGFGPGNGDMIDFTPKCPLQGSEIGEEREDLSSQSKEKGQYLLYPRLIYWRSQGCTWGP